MRFLMWVFKNPKGHNSQIDLYSIRMLYIYNGYLNEEHLLTLHPFTTKRYILKTFGNMVKHIVFLIPSELFLSPNKLGIFK